jgi:hypothetical protein
LFSQLPQAVFRKIQHPIITACILAPYSFGIGIDEHFFIIAEKEKSRTLNAFESGCGFSNAFATTVVLAKEGRSVFNIAAFNGIITITAIACPFKTLCMDVLQKKRHPKAPQNFLMAFI